MIKGNEKLDCIADKYPILIPEFEKNGMAYWFKPDNLDKLGRFVSLNSLLASSKIDSTQFIMSLNSILNDNSFTTPSSVMNEQRNLQLLAMLPCGLRNPFKELLENHIADNQQCYSSFNYLAEGNVNHELSYYPLIDTIASEDELPDIILSADVNSFFHSYFMKHFISKGVFNTYYPYKPNRYFEQVNYYDPFGNFTMLTANMLVMVIDTKKLGTREIPRLWEDILSEDFKSDIIMRGEDDFFCNAVMLPFYKDHGFDAIRAMARNIKAGKHPAEMVKLAGSDNDDAATVYIMPYFFAKQIKCKTVKIVWPIDGAIASPVFMLIKKNAIEKHTPMLEFLLSKQISEMFMERYFPPVHPQVDTARFPEKVKWLGWDFLLQNDIGNLKKNIQDVFMKDWNNRSLNE